MSIVFLIRKWDYIGEKKHGKKFLCYLLQVNVNNDICECKGHLKFIG